MGLISRVSRRTYRKHLDSMTMSSTASRTTRRQHKETTKIASKGQQTIPSVSKLSMGLRTRSKNHENTPSPRNVDIGKKVVSSIKIWTDDENSNPGSELPPRTRRKSSNETRISASTFQSETASLLEQQASPQAGSRLEQKVTVEIGVPVNSEDLDILCDEEIQSVEYWKKKAQSTMKDLEKVSEELNTSNFNFEEMTKVNEGLVEENEKLVKRCDEYQEELEFLITQIEQQNVRNRKMKRLRIIRQPIN